MANAAEDHEWLNMWAEKVSDGMLSRLKALSKVDDFPSLRKIE